MNKLIKIQSFVRGAEIRDKIKLKGKAKIQNKNDFSFDNSMITPVVGNENNELQQKYNELIVNI